MVTARGDKLPILFLWHHHQPFYCAPHRDRPELPWVRLHAVRGYLDILAVARETGSAMTVNFSPALLTQINEMSRMDICDDFERISRTPAHELLEEEKKYILRNFFSINWTVHIKGHERYEKLLSKRGDPSVDPGFRTAIVDYTAQDFIDLIALFNLAWIGFTGRRDPQIAELIKKGKDYAPSDIDAILSFHHQVLKGTIPGYRDLYSSGQIEISTSPYSHAILPLLCDSAVASPDIPRQLLPRPDYCHPEDAEFQLRLAASTHEEIWGTAAAGLWPSEGSVSEEVLNIAAGCNFRWLATDQGILERSERTKSAITSHFVPYQWASTEAGIRVYFRDRALSDAIGFRYSGMRGEDASGELVNHLERIASGTKETPNRCVVIALDGENPWESYSDGGEAFLKTLFRTLDQHPELTTSRFSDHLKTGTRERIQRLHPGSWIDSNFRIWIGDPEKNQAWLELGRARHALDELMAGDPRRDECWKWLLRAQCSDWMWWFGEPFNSMYESQFDALFREYLRTIYREAGREPPPALDVPIAVPPKTERRLQPAFPMLPTIDGRDTSFYEWVGACRIDPRQFGTTMGRAEHFLRHVFYGFGEKELYFRFDPASTLHPQTNSILRFNVLGHRQVSIEIALGHPSPRQHFEGVTWAFHDVAEIAISRDRIDLPSGGECQFWLDIVDETMVLEKLPPTGAFHFNVPTTEAVAANWIV